MQVFIRDDTTRVYNISDDTTLGGLCALIEKREKKVSSHQRLTFNGKILMAWNMKLVDFGVKNNSTLHLHMSWPTKPQDDVISPHYYDFDHALQQRARKRRHDPSCWACFFG